MRGTKPKTEWTQEQIEAIHDAYRQSYFPVKTLSSSPLFLGVTNGQIKHLAKRLGIQRKQHWGREEHELVMRGVGERSSAEIARILWRKFRRRRTPAQVTAYINDHGMSARADRLGMREVMRLFRVGSEKVRRWVREGKLPNARFGGEDGDTGFFRWKPVDIVVFMREWPWELEGAYIDVPWVMALLEEGWNEVSRRKRENVKEKRKGGIRDENENVDSGGSDGSGDGGGGDPGDG